MSMSTQPLIQVEVDKLRVRVYEKRMSMGAAAAAMVRKKVRETLAAKDKARIVFAAAPSQNEVLEHLCRADDIDWSRVVAFHMDEYVGLPSSSPQHFSHYLQEHLFQQVNPGEVHLIRLSQHPEQTCAEYAQLLSAAPIDIVCLGIGENGHIAFNDPGVADFRDPVSVKLVQLDEACRMQQVHDGCFPNLEAVPTQAVTLTVPALMSASHLICAVPGPTKREAVKAVLTGAISERCPASILRTHADCAMFLDIDAYGVAEHA